MSKTSGKPAKSAMSKTVKQLSAKMAEHEQSLPADVEAAWATWIGGIQKVDERAKTLLRAAFEAGVEAGKADR